MRKFYSFSIYLYNHRIIRFLFSGGTAVAVNLATLFVLVHFFKVWYLLAAVVSFTTAVFASFMLQKFFTFNDRVLKYAGKQATFYLGFQVLNLGLNTLFMYIGVDILHIQYIIAQVLIGSVMAVSNFFVYKHLVFTPDAVYNKSL
jgi:putative flippase GtrA